MDNFNYFGNNELKIVSPPYQRISIRLKGYDDSFPSAYFITILCYNRYEIFGEVVNGELKLNKQGQIAA